MPHAGLNWFGRTGSKIQELSNRLKTCVGDILPEAQVLREVCWEFLTPYRGLSLRLVALDEASHYVRLC